MSSSHSTSTVVVVSDFATDYYHGIMKGVISKSHPAINFIDIGIPKAHSIITTSWILLNSINFMPDNAIYLIVVDPGVGTARKEILARNGDRYFICPDNGILPACLDENTEYFSLERPENTSSTFHGRDIFAPAVVEIIGIISKDRTLPYTSHTPLRADWDIRPTFKQGMVTHIDSFGNIVTNLLIPPDFSSINISYDGGEVLDIPIVNTFQEAESRRISGLIGSCGTLELVIDKGRTADQLDLEVGLQVILNENTQTNSIS